MRSSPGRCLVLLTLAGCGAQADAPADDAPPADDHIAGTRDDDDPIVFDDPLPDDRDPFAGEVPKSAPAGTITEAAAPASPSGSWSVESTFDLTVEGALPDPALGALQRLEQLRDDPADLLFDLLDEAGVPLAEQLRDDLPGPLEDALEGWIDDQIEDAEYGGTPVVDHLDALLAVSDTVLGSFDLISELEVPDRPAKPRARHRALALRIPSGSPLVLEVPAIDGLDQVLALEASPTAALGPDGALVLGEHAFGLPYGELAWLALDWSLHEQYGTDLRGVIGALVDCASIAEEVSDQCIFGACVGHRDELEELCGEALDLLADEVESRFAEARFDAIALERGEAQVDLGSLRHGIWDAQVDFGLGPRGLPARFAGTRSH